MEEAKDYHNEPPPQTLACLTRKGLLAKGPIDRWIKSERTEEQPYQGRVGTRGKAASSSSRTIEGKKRKLPNTKKEEAKKLRERNNTITGWCVWLSEETEERRGNEEHEEDASYHGTPPAGIG
jgi:hypothetical protein